MLGYIVVLIGIILIIVGIKAHVDAVAWVGGGAFLAGWLFNGDGPRAKGF
jgi:Na+-transporting NADH:ubiquinone oxidoreductase subunit NqrB